MRARCAWALAVIFALTPRTSIADEPWQRGVAVQMSASKIALLLVRTTLQMDYDFARRTQGPTSFNDCVTIANRAAVDVVRLQFMYAMASGDGTVKAKPLSLDVRYLVKPGEVRDDRANCLDHGYANGGNLWFVAWVNEVDFSDGTSWRAPAISQMTPYIRDTLSQAEGSLISLLPYTQ